MNKRLLDTLESNPMDEIKEEEDEEKESFAIKEHQDFIEARLSTTESEDESNNLTINEEVIITEHAPSVFNAIKKMDGIKSNKIITSLNVDSNNS